MKIVIYLFSIIVISVNLSYSQSTTSTDTVGTFSDSRDWHVYKWIKIDTQIWMAENLAYLPKINKTSEWGSGLTPYYHVYDYNGTNVDSAKATYNYKTYGVLYNWPAVNGSCPNGWHLPTYKEWTTLTDYLGGDSIAGVKLKESGTVHWKCQNNIATNSSGFTALPGGGRTGLENKPNGIGWIGYWWSTGYDRGNAWHQSLDCVKGNLAYTVKWQCFSVRCIKN